MNKHHKKKNKPHKKKNNPNLNPFKNMKNPIDRKNITNQLTNQLIQKAINPNPVII